MAGRGVLGNFARSLQSLTLASRPVAAPLVAPSMATAAAAQREMTTAKSRARKAGVPHSKTVKIMGHIDRGQKQKIFFPNTIVQFMPNQQYNEQNELTCVKFRVDPRMNKNEMKQWIEAGYDTPVHKVHTANYEGRIKRVPNMPSKIYRRTDYKVAFVYLEKKWKPRVGAEDTS